MIGQENFCILHYIKSDPLKDYPTRVPFYNLNKIKILELYWYHNYSVRSLIEYFGRGTFNGFNRLLTYYFGSYHQDRCKLLGKINRSNHISKMNKDRVITGENPFLSINRKLDEFGNDIIAAKSKFTQKLNHTNPFYHENLSFDSDGKSIIHKRSRITILNNGTCPFSSNNRPKDDLGKDIYQIRMWKSRKINNLKHYGCEIEQTSYWRRTPENSDPNSKFYLTNDQIDSHNFRLFSLCSNRGKRLYSEKFRRNTFISYPERLLGELINNLGLYYKKQYPVPKPGGWFYFADYYIPSLNLVLECDGDFKYVDNKLKSIYIIRAKIIESKIKGRVININELDVYYYKSHLNELLSLMKGGNNGRCKLHG